MARGNKVEPSNNDSPEYTIVEVRRGRHLRIRHINPRARPVKFEKEYSIALRKFRANSQKDKRRSSVWSILSKREQTKSPSEKLVDLELIDEKERRKDLHDEISDDDNHPGVIFFIHGVGGSVDVWSSQLNHFASQGYEIVAFDHIGHGFSHAPRKKRAYHFKEISFDVLAIFDQYCKGRNHIVGHSYGCSFSAVLAVERSPWVKNIVFISGGSPTPLHPQPGVFSLPSCCLSCFKGLVTKTFQKNAFALKSTANGKAFSIPAYVLKFVMAGQLWDGGDATYHSQIQSPCLIIHGEEDNLITLSDEMEMKEALPNARLEVLSDSSHMVMMEKDDMVNYLIQNFLSRK